MNSGYKKFVSAMYVINIALQGIFTLLTPIALAVFVSWLLTARSDAPSWVFVPFILVGVFAGLISMVKFILGAMRQLERLEKQHEQSERQDTDRK